MALRVSCSFSSDVLVESIKKVNERYEIILKDKEKLMRKLAYSEMEFEKEVKTFCEANKTAVSKIVKKIEKKRSNYSHKVLSIYVATTFTEESTVHMSSIRNITNQQILRL